MSIDDMNPLFSQSAYRLPTDRQRLTLRQPPRLDDPSAERLHRKQRLAASYRLFAQLGFEVGVAGHFTARDPIEPDHFWINPFGVPFSQICVSHLQRVNGQGEVVEGEGVLNTSALELHYDLQQARPDVVGIAHVHGLHGRVWSSLGKLFEPIIAESNAFIGDQVIFERLALRNAEGHIERNRERVSQAFVQTFAQNNLLFWQNHGLWTVGQSVETAAWRCILADDTARAHLLAYAAGTPIVPDMDAPRKDDRAGQEFFAWLNFLPLWDRIVREQPDLLD